MNDKLTTQEQVMNKLGVSDISEMSSGKIAEFIKLIPAISKDVAMSMFNQLPMCADTAKVIVTEFNKLTDSAVKSNEKSQIEAIKAYQAVIDSLSKKLNNGNLTFEEQQYYTEKLIEVANLAAQKDSENKAFIAKESEKLRSVLKGVGFGFSAVIAFVGITVIGSGKDKGTKT